MVHITTTTTHTPLTQQRQTVYSRIGSLSSQTMPEKQDAQTPRHSVSCEACGDAVSVDRSKKYCGECKVTMLQQRVSEGGLAASQEGVLQAVQGGYPSERVLREGQADVQSSFRRE